MPADLLIRKSENTGVLVCNLSFVRCFSVSVNNHREATRATTVYITESVASGCSCVADFGEDAGFATVFGRAT